MCRVESCPIAHSRNKLLEANLAYMRSHMKYITPEDTASLSEQELLSVLESDELEIDREMQVFDFIQRRKTVLGSRKQPFDLERLLKVCSHHAGEC